MVKEIIVSFDLMNLRWKYISKTHHVYSDIFSFKIVILSDNQQLYSQLKTLSQTGKSWKFPCKLCCRSLCAILTLKSHSISRPLLYIWRIFHLFNTAEAGAGTWWSQLVIISYRMNYTCGLIINNVEFLLSCHFLIDEGAI